MCELAVGHSNWLMVDPWEAQMPEYMPTALVLDHFDHEINDVLGGAIKPNGERVRVKIVLLVSIIYRNIPLLSFRG
jgi:nicotinamide mononucleotide adenylyltransferase